MQKYFQGLPALPSLGCKIQNRIQSRHFCPAKPHNHIPAWIPYTVSNHMSLILIHNCVPHRKIYTPTPANLWCDNVYAICLVKIIIASERNVSQSFVLCKATYVAKAIRCLYGDMKDTWLTPSNFSTFKCNAITLSYQLHRKLNSIA